VNFFSPSALNVTARECGPRTAQVFTSAWPRTAAPMAPEVMLSLAPIDAAAAERPFIALEHVDLDVRRRLQRPLALGVLILRHARPSITAVLVLSCEAISS
jgi:hypothetical protein